MVASRSRRALVGLALRRLALLDHVLEARHLLHQGLGRRLVLARLGLADLLGGGVAARLRLLQFLNRGAALLVQAQNSIQRGLRIVETAVRQPLEKGVLVVADPFDVEHGEWS